MQIAEKANPDLRVAAAEAVPPILTSIREWLPVPRLGHVPTVNREVVVTEVLPSTVRSSTLKLPPSISNPHARVNVPVGAALMYTVAASLTVAAPAVIDGAVICNPAKSACVPEPASTIVPEMCATRALVPAVGETLPPATSKVAKVGEASAPMRVAAANRLTPVVPR